MLENLIKKIREMKAKRIEELNLPEGETNDMALKSLRRQRQHQMEEQEKLRLKREIALYRKEQVKRNLYGVVRDIKSKQVFQKRPFLKNKSKWL